MATTGILALIFVVILTFVQSTEGANITTGPVSVTTGPFETAEFTCEGTGDSIMWIVGSSPLTNKMKQERDITVIDSSSGNNLSSILAITALPVNDGIGIGCRIISNNPFSEVFSSESTLTIRGISSVKNFTLLRRNGYLEANWSPPAFHSNDIAGGVVFTYEVTVTNGEGIPITREAVSNTFVSLNVTECDAFNISVTAFGGPYSSTFSTWNSGSYSVDIEKVRLMLQENGLCTCNVFFGLKGTPNVCQGRILVNVTRLSDGNTTVNEIVVNASLESYELIGHDITDLEPFEHYNITAVILNSIDCPKDQESMTITTYNVQGINVSSPYTNGSVSVKCLFINGSIADGCRVVFRDTAQGIEESFNIIGSAEIVSPSVSGNYTVTAYDLVNGTIFGPAVEYPLPVVVHVLVIMPTPSSSMSIDSDINAYTDIISSTASFFVTSPAMHVPMSPSETSDTYQIGIIIGGAVGAAIACCCTCAFVIALVVVLVKKKPCCSDGGEVSKKIESTKDIHDVHQATNSSPVESNNGRSTCTTVMPSPPGRSSMKDKNVFQNGFASTTEDSDIYTIDPHRCGTNQPEIVTDITRKLASKLKQGTMRGNEKHEDIEMLEMMPPTV